MAGSAKIYALSAITLSMLAFVTTLSLPASYSNSTAASTQFFARCEACHPESFDTIRINEHYRMRCLECHRISNFRQNNHISTIPKCGDCHADISAGIVHSKFTPAYSPKNSRNDRSIVYSFVKPENGTI